MTFDQLPPDQYSVRVENDMDSARLLWLVNKIGETQLRKSVAKYQTRYPGTKPFVSVILGWYQLTVPVAVYAPRRVPVYWLYLLSVKGSGKVKIGFTGRWPYRAFDFLRGPRYFPVRTDQPDLLQPPSRQAALLELLEGETSSAYLVGPAREEATRREKMAKKAFAAWRTSPPAGLLQYGTGGRTEWFDARIVDQFRQLAASFDPATSIQSLRAALAAIEAAGEPCAPMWARLSLGQQKKITPKSTN
jgi:hypothetical protein